MIFVKVWYYRYGEDFYGEITWDGKELKGDHESDEMTMILTSPIIAPMEDGKLRKIYPDQDPELFIKKLCWQYHGMACKVGVAKER